MTKKLCSGAFFIVVTLTLVLGLGFSDGNNVAYAGDSPTVTIRFFDRGVEVVNIPDVELGTTMGDQVIPIPDITTYITEYPEGTGPQAGLENGTDYVHTPPVWYVGDKPFKSDTALTNELVGNGEIRVDTRYFYNQYWVTIVYDNNKQLKKLVTYDGTVEITTPPGGLVFGQYLSFDSEETKHITEPKTIIVYVKTFVWYLVGAILLGAFIAGIAVLIASRKEERLIKRDELLRERLLIAAKNQDSRITRLQAKRIKREEEMAQKLAEEEDAKRKATEEIDGFPKI